MSLDKVRYVRRIFTFHDLLAGLGGLFTSISQVSLVILAGINYFGSY